MDQATRHRTEEPDIGSGEPSPGQHDTDKMIEQVPATPPMPTSTPPIPGPAAPTATPPAAST